MKHTPGPWEVVDKSYSGVGSLEGLPSVQVSDDGLTVAQLCDTGNEQADAHLIAAAPELLEALQEAVKEFERIKSAERVQPTNQVLAKIGLAIAKAMGEGE